PVGDITAGMFAAHAILAALVARTRTRQGAYIDVALNDALLALHTYQAGRFFATGEAPGREGNPHATIAPYGTFKVREGFINVAVGSDAQYLRFCEVLAAPELASDPRFATNAQRQSARADLITEIEHRLQGDSRAHWLDLLEQHGIPAGAVMALGAAFSRPLATER